MWSYKSKAGTFSIRPLPDGRWGLQIGNEYLGSYISPEQAADDVYMQQTGYYPWDSLPPVSEPCELAEWEKS